MYKKQTLAIGLSLALLASGLSPSISLARPGGGSRGGGGGSFRGGGASPRMNSSINLQNSGNVRGPAPQNRSTNINRGNINTGNINTGNINRENINSGNINRGNINTGNINTGNINTGNINRGNNVNINTGDINVNTRWYGGGWYGRGYYRPPGWGAWGAAAFATGVVIGATINSLPPYYSTVYVSGSPYFYSDGVYFTSQGDTYVVVAPPLGAIVTNLPEGCSTTQYNNVLVYNCSNVFYEPFYQNGSTVYKVVQVG